MPSLTAPSSRKQTRDRAGRCSSQSPKLKANDSLFVWNQSIIRIARLCLKRSPAKPVVVLLEQTEQRSLRPVQTSGSIIYQLLRGIEVALDGLASFEIDQNS